MLLGGCCPWRLELSFALFALLEVLDEVFNPLFGGERRGVNHWTQRQDLPKGTRRRLASLRCPPIRRSAAVPPVWKALLFGAPSSQARPLALLKEKNKAEKERAKGV